MNNSIELSKVDMKEAGLVELTELEMENVTGGKKLRLLGALFAVGCMVGGFLTANPVGVFGGALLLIEIANDNP